MAIRLYVLMLLAARAVAQTVEGSVFDAAKGTGVGGVKVELLKGATPFYETTTDRSEEHTSELQSLRHLVCRLLLEKKEFRGTSMPGWTDARSRARGNQPDTTVCGSDSSAREI